MSLDKIMTNNNNNPLIVSKLDNNNKDKTNNNDDESSTTTNDKIPTRLILHLDINETILLGDELGGDTRHDSVNKMLAKSAFCQIPASSANPDDVSYEDTSKLSPTHWWDGQEIGKEQSIPPLYTGWTWPPNCCPYYRTNFKKVSKTFVEHHGKIYQPLLDQCETAIRTQTAIDDESHILPALYHTLNTLMENEDQQPFTVVFRTFGKDLPDIAQAIIKYATGKHSNYPHVNHPSFCQITNHLYQGRWKQLDDEGNVIYQLWDVNEQHVVASGDAEILALLEQVPICGIRDDYPYWSQNQWNPSAGKPIWVPHYNQGGKNIYDHHILFDDNIHNLQNDGIACVRKQQPDGSFITVDPKTMHQEYQGTHMVRVPTVEPVLNVNWFIEQIQQAREQVIFGLAKK